MGREREIATVVVNILISGIIFTIFARERGKTDALLAQIPRI